MHHRSFIKVGELRHVVGFVKLGRIDLVDILRAGFALLADLSAHS
jgi:hypothetical protein